MKIHNVRLGFASNSSSSHSLIFLKNIKDIYNPDMGFGWDNFTLSSTYAKNKYLASTLYYALKPHLDNSLSNIIIEQLTGEKLHFDRCGPKEYIDHQSIICLPLSHRTPHNVSLQFFEEFKRYIFQKDLVILGGNDNEDKHPLDDGTSFTLPLPMDEYNAIWIARKDETYNYWSLFNKGTGAKIRFSFDDLAVKPTKSTYPELVDLKITNYCKGHCDYCYMDSNSEGKHAETNDVYNIISELARIGVFEVSLGGGDVLSHPDFIEIINWCNNKGIVPNFTTNRIDWLSVPEYLNIIDKIGALSLTAVEQQDILQLYSKMNSHNIPLNKCSINIVEGVVDTYELELLLSTAETLGIRVVLLGYKHTGRGNSFKPQECNVWEAISNCRHLPTISVDTTIINKYPEEIKQYPRILYDASEGEFSCYIDAVDMKAGKSSYSDLVSINTNNITDVLVNKPW